MEELTRYERSGGFSGIGLSDVPGSIVIDSSRLSYDRCPAYDLTFVYTHDGRLMNKGQEALPAKPQCAALRSPDYNAPSLPSALDILPLIHSNPWVEELSGGRLLIANEEFGLILSRSLKR
ncbi:hypothetical protein GCM10022280_09350 [Sphingomonas swuensis]|uniref:Uncharacterized protein n=2 Tax=Sphingomonas swuensis TaxID=977800 RepID=A0ABP7SLJ6_9SPHN